MAMNVFKQALSIGQMVWLALWTEQHYSSFNSMGYLGVYAFLGISVGVIAFVKTCQAIVSGVRAGEKLHRLLFTSVLYARMSFFDETPLGRILQRFSKDMSVIDTQLPFTWSSTLEFITSLTATMLTITFVQPAVLPFFIPIGYVYFKAQGYFRGAYREIKRLEGISGSPIYAHFSETLAGLLTVRAFGHQSRFVEENLARVEANQRAFYAQKCACDRWLPIRLETVGNSIALVTAVFAVTFRGSTYAAFVGLVLTFALDVTGLLSWVVRQWSDTESQMVSVERVSEYVGLDPEEATGAALRGGPADPPPAWPRSGSLKVENLQMRYRPTQPLVLRGVSFELRAGEKAGVVGRTGSGKSTLLAALWRLAEPEAGRIFLDGVDTLRLSLRDLRRALSCIPQDPFLFSGTVRRNLDPFDEHTDQRLWDALQHTELKAAVSELDGGLEGTVAEFGENFSAGQRQLICLARALLRKSHVVCLDEATASVDLETDKLIQQVVAKEFRECTVLTIAHRLHTIIDGDTVLCMDHGLMVAKGSPHELLSANDGNVFASLVEEVGGLAGEQLASRAQTSHNVRVASAPAP